MHNPWDVLYTILWGFVYRYIFSGESPRSSRRVILWTQSTLRMFPSTSVTLWGSPHSQLPAHHCRWVKDFCYTLTINVMLPEHHGGCCLFNSWCKLTTEKIENSPLLVLYYKNPSESVDSPPKGPVNIYITIVLRVVLDKKWSLTRG